MISIEKLIESRELLRKWQRELHIDLSDMIREINSDLDKRKGREEEGEAD